MKLKVVAAAVMALSTLNAYAAQDVTPKELAKCAAIQGDLARLECFDTLTQDKRLNKPQKEASNVAGSGKWIVDVEVNPIDDSKTVLLALDADSGKTRWNKTVSLLARCKSNKTELYIAWHDYLGSEAEVLTRVGDSKAKTREWSLSTDKKATFHPRPIELLKEMLSADKLVAQVTPYNENPITAAFDTKGLSNAIKPLRETCKW